MEIINVVFVSESQIVSEHVAALDMDNTLVKGACRQRIRKARHQTRL